MRATRTVAVPATTCEEYDYTCDKCGAPCGEDDATGAYDVRQVELHADEGEQYPGSSFVTRTEIDCCMVCYKAHVIPALEALGFTPRTEDRSW